MTRPAGSNSMPPAARVRVSTPGAKLTRPVVSVKSCSVMALVSTLRALTVCAVCVAALAVAVYVPGGRFRI